MITTHVLHILDPHGDFIICINASLQGLDGVLSQDEKPIAYESRKLKTREMNYATHDLELVAIIHALKMWRHYLLGNSSKLEMNNQNLKYLFT